MLFIAAPAHAGSTVDWARGLVFGPGAAAADLRAPSADIARLKARRIAMERARTALAKQARSLPWAGGGDVGAQLRTAAQKRRFDRVIARSLARDVDYASDGSVMLRAAAPVEAIRLAIVGSPQPPALAAPGTQQLTALVVDATRLAIEPRVNMALVAGSERYEGPTVYHRRPNPATTLWGDRVIRVKAIRATTSGQMILDPGFATARLAAAREAGALVVIMLRPEGGSRPR